MILKTELKLNDEEEWDITSTIVEEIRLQIKNQVKRELKSDPKVIKLMNKLKAASIKKMMDSFDDQ